MTSANEKRYWITILHAQHSYEVHAWTPFLEDQAGSTVPGQSTKGLETLGGPSSPNPFRAM